MASDMTFGTSDHDRAGGVLPPELDGKLLMRMPEARFRLLLPGDASAGTALYKVGIVLTCCKQALRMPFVWAGVM